MTKEDHLGEDLEKERYDQMVSPLTIKNKRQRSSRATSQWITPPGIVLAPNSLNFGVPTTPKPGLTSTSAHSHHTVSGSDTKLLHPGIGSAVARYCPLWAPLSGPHGFVSGSSRATSQWVTHPGIALAPNSLNFRVPTTPKPVSSQKASC
ncbi:hypothetical protein L3X38_036926 [Prunus dulcis]|uniref:Uncharacterized protein n=1 Tax=Prunus dulcis TaxID=3755 RepID=A0AAD4V2D8_PRUDU|nr:hypothetical protein L3X38_036926 [Prunus dulcis]